MKIASKYLYHPMRLKIQKLSVLKSIFEPTDPIPIRCRSFNYLAGTAVGSFHNLQTLESGSVANMFTLHFENNISKDTFQKTDLWRLGRCDLKWWDGLGKGNDSRGVESNIWLGSPGSRFPLGRILRRRLALRGGRG